MVRPSWRIIAEWNLYLEEAIRSPLRVVSVQSLSDYDQKQQRLSVLGPCKPTELPGR